VPREVVDMAAENNKDQTTTLPVPGDGDRKLSIPNSVQRRKFGSLQGSYTRAIVVAVDPSESAKDAFCCTC